MAGSPGANAARPGREMRRPNEGLLRGFRTGEGFRRRAILLIIRKGGEVTTIATAALPTSRRDGGARASKSGARHHRGVIHHVGVFASDLSRSRGIYEAALRPLGIIVGYETDRVAEFWRVDDDTPSLSLERGDGFVTSGCHIAFEAQHREAVDEFFSHGDCCWWRVATHAEVLARIQRVRRVHHGPGRQQHRSAAQAGIGPRTDSDIASSGSRAPCDHWT